MPDDSGTGDEGPSSTSSKFYRNHAPFTARIKKMMQSDEDVGKVAKVSPILISKALDVFLASMMEGAVHIAQQRNAKVLTTSHVKAHIMSDPLLDFCLEAVALVPDLPAVEEETVASPRAPRKRAKAATKEGSDSAEPPKPRDGKQQKKTGGPAELASLPPPGMEAQVPGVVEVKPAPAHAAPASLPIEEEGGGPPLASATEGGEGAEPASTPALPEGAGTTVHVEAEEGHAAMVEASDAAPGREGVPTPETAGQDPPEVEPPVQEFAAPAVFAEEEDYDE